ncbi:MAG: CocE/NonD family hydrolase, partial [Alphaproteobacteria bacterium]
MIVAKDAAVKVVTDFPRRVREIEHVGIAMADGVRLSARIWLPEDAETNPVPAILEYIPYRKRDGTRAWDDPRHRYWAGHGYAAVRLDIRGTGDSEGLITDEYAKQEQDDAVEAIAWLAAQPWCTGKVGMTGISWGGFNALQVAARRPPALAAIITHCSTDDRYADDVHYMGGCLLTENFFWGSAFLQFMARPADPRITGAGWREQWLRRLESWRPVASQ